VGFAKLNLHDGEIEDLSVTSTNLEKKSRVGTLNQQNTYTDKRFGFNHFPGNAVTKYQPRASRLHFSFNKWRISWRILYRGWTFVQDSHDILLEASLMESEQKSILGKNPPRKIRHLV